MRLTSRSWCGAVPPLACAALLACGVLGARGDPDVRSKRRRCTLPRVPGEAPESTAVRCAEWFVARNGYTDLPVADTGAVASESIERAASVAELLAERRSSLSRRAAVVCRGARRGSGYTVGFTDPARADTLVGRAVTMDTAFRALRVEHPDYLIAQRRANVAECRPLGP
ncbi:MAG TPA: hypothetical protein VKA84_14645 [Gemmatimonadaceae bacterium]|nr:hypothetical protein [Gemmatimonadaceae bacterium]